MLYCGEGSTLYCGEGSTLSQTKATLLFNALLNHLKRVCWCDGVPRIVKKQTTMKHLHSVFICHVVLVPHRHTRGPVRGLQRRNGDMVYKSTTLYWLISHQLYSYGYFD